MKSTKTKKTFIILPSALILLFIFLSMNISHSETLKSIPEEVYDELCDFYEETSFECGLKPSMLVWIDLDLDGELEILIDGKDILTFKGPSEYSTWIFKKKETKFVLLNHFWGNEIKVLRNKTNSYFDLSQNYNEPNEKKTEFRLNKRVYRFDKEKGKYVLNSEN